MPALSCSAMTCVYNQNELCSKGDIRVGGSGAKSSMETCCESFKERGEGTMSNSTGCGCTKIGVDCKAQNCTFNDNCKCEAGVFRAGGDTKFGLVCDTIDMWCYAVPLGFIAAFVFKLPVLVVYFLLCTDEFVKWPWVLKRYKSGLWAKNITRDHLFEDEEKE